MSAIVPSSLDSALLARRLGELVGDERNVQVDFLLHLDEFDRRRAYLEAGFGSLWDYCLRLLHLREGAAGRRIGAMRVLRRLPRLEGALRDGRLCLSTASVLGPVLTHDNLDDLVARAAYGTKAEVEHLVASLHPRAAPKEGIRKIASHAAASSGSSAGDASNEDLLAARRPGPEQTPALALAPPAEMPPHVETPPPPSEPARPRPAEIRPVSEDQWSLRVTLDASCKEELETLRALLSHKIPGGDTHEVLREAIRCGIEKHGNRKGANRKGASAPAQKRKPSPARAERSEIEQHPYPAVPATRIPAAIRREVWKRDGGACAWTSADGRRCGSRWQLELDHIVPPLLGGTSTLANLRLACRLCRERHKRHYADSELMPRPSVEPALAWSDGARDAA